MSSREKGRLGQSIRGDQNNQTTVNIAKQQFTEKLDIVLIGGSSIVSQLENVNEKYEKNFEPFATCQLIPRQWPEASEHRDLLHGDGILRPGEFQIWQ